MGIAVTKGCGRRRAKAWGPMPGLWLKPVGLELRKARGGSRAGRGAQGARGLALRDETSPGSLLEMQSPRP